MKDKKIFILITVAGIAAFILFSSSQPVEKNGQQPNLGGITQETNIAQLESQVQQLRGLITAFVGLNQSLKASFQEEKEQRAALKEALAEAGLQNESLSKELNQARVSIELTLPIKQSIDKIQNSLSALSLVPGKEKELTQQLSDISRQLKLVDAQIPSLLKENASYKHLANTLQGVLEKQEGDIAALRSALDEEKAQKQAAKNTQSLSERKSADFEKTRNNLLATNASLYAEISRLTQALKDTQRKLSQTAREKETSNTREAKTLRQDNQKLQEELNQLRAQLAQFQKDSAGLQKDYAALQETIKNNEAALGSRADKIVGLEEKLSEAQMKLTEIQSHYNALEKESAGLREQNVAVQLEREELRAQLNQSRLQLGGLESRLSQIGAIFRQPQNASSQDTEGDRSVLKTTNPAGTAPPKEEAKRVEVELYPVPEVTAAQDTGK